MSRHIRGMTTALVLTALCLSVGQAALAQARLSRQDQVREVVLRYLFHKYRHEGAVPAGVKVFFIGGSRMVPNVGQRGRDLSDALMQRFSTNIPTVRRVSREVVSGYGFKDKVTGAAGMLFQINDVLRISKNSATVDAEVFTGAIMQATVAHYDLTYNGVRWKVVKEYNVMST